MILEEPVLHITVVTTGQLSAFRHVVATDHALGYTFHEVDISPLYPPLYQIMLEKSIINSVVRSEISHEFL